ncbi:MAG TPA: hypothetical protein VG754_08430 [Verrucomicrobiae bacterium]|nr:hypothetical protein [Verrucomicrobiae bacterium]
MTSRITFLLVALFWMTMTFLLWRSEYVGHTELGSSVPVELVWRKILTAPDDSGLEIMHNGKKLGYCGWAANVGQDQAAGKVLSDEVPPEGMVPELTSYRLNLKGNVAVNESGNRLKFDLEIRLTTNQVWQAFDLRLNLRPMVWEVHSVANEQKVRLVVIEGKGRRTEQVFKFSDLQDPQGLMQDLGVPAPLGLLGLMNAGILPKNGGTNTPSLDLGLDWKARNDWVSIGHTSVRAYRLEATLLERYRMRVIVSGVGEILRVDLPDGWELINDQFVNL